MKPPLDQTARADQSRNWFINPRANARAGARLLFFPYAGAGPAVFSPWFAQLPRHIEGWAAHLPGRGSRSSEPARKSLIPMVEELVQAIQPLLDRPYALFGHSLGALVAFELARCLRRAQLPQPAALFISACGAPHLPDPVPAIHALPEAKFLEALKEFNGISPELLRQREVLDLLLPALRADFEALETYVYVPEPPLDCRLVAFGGGDDPRVSREQLEAWGLQTNSSFRSEYFSGDHFFINTAKEAIIESIAREINVFCKSA